MADQVIVVTVPGPVSIVSVPETNVQVSVAMATGPAGVGVPAGGTASQVLAKIDATNYNTQWVTPAGGGDMVLASTQTNSGLKTFLNATFGLRNVANTFTGLFTNAITAVRTWTLKDADGTIAFTSDITGINSGTNTGDNAVNTLYSGLVSNANHTGDATGATALTVVAINGTTLAGLATGILKNTTGTGVPSIAINSDLPVMSSTVGGAVPTPPNNTTTFLRGDGTFAAPSASVAISTAIVDFGATAIDTVATVITDAGVSATSKILLSPYFTTALALGRDVEEIIIDPINVVVVPGTGNFTIYAAAILGTVSGKYGFSYTVG